MPTQRCHTHPVLTGSDGRYRALAYVCKGSDILPVLVCLELVGDWATLEVVLAGWLDRRVVSVLDSCAEGPGFKLQLKCCRVTVLGKLFTPIVPLFSSQRNW